MTENQMRDSEATDQRATERIPSIAARRILKEEELKEQALDEEEQLDTVAPLTLSPSDMANMRNTEIPGYARLATEDGTQRNSSVHVASSAQMRGLQQETDLEKRMELISGGTVQPDRQAKDDLSNRLRAPSVI